MRRSARPRFHSRVELLETRILPTTLIAVIDDGVNPDSTNSGYLDTADAYNAVERSDNDLSDATGHGTEMADRIATSIQNASKLMGIKPSVEILPIKDWDPTLYGNQGGISSSAVIDGIYYAITKGASVINLSFAGPLEDWDSDSESPHHGDTISQAIRQAESANAIVVIAAGNSGDIIGGIQYGNQNIDSETPYGVYPAVLAHDVPLPNAIVATASDSSGNLSAVANYGANHVDLAAPNTYYTSDAAADVSGIVGVVGALNPGASYTTIRNLITQNVQAAAGLAGKTVTGGMISAYNSMLASYPDPTASASPARVAGTTTTLSVDDSYGGGDAGLTYTWSVTSMPSGVTAPSYNTDGKSTAVTFHSAGNYTFQATVTDGQGFSRTAPVSLTVNQTATTIAVSSSSAIVGDGGSHGFGATVYDQFGAVISSPSLTWSVNGGGVGGTVNQVGTYTAPSSGAGTDKVKVASGSAGATATVTVTSASGQSVSGAVDAPISYSADTGFSPSSTYSVMHPIDTSEVVDPAPQEVYQTERNAGYQNLTSFTYTVPNLTPDAPYAVRLDFAELYFSQANQRKFDVAINGVTVLSNFDLFAAAGGQYIAISRTFCTTSDGSGDIVVQFTDVPGFNNAKVDGIVVTPIPVAAIDAGGVGAGLYAADADDDIGAPYSSPHPIDTSEVADPAPQEIYQTERWDRSSNGLLAYTIPNLTPDAPYVVRLDFAELYFDRPNQRKFDVAINGDTVLSNFDIYAAAGGEYIAISRSFTVTTDGSGHIAIQFTNIAGYDHAKVDGILVTPVPSIAIDAGGTGAPSYAADSGYSASSTFSTTDSINTSGVADPAPQGVYQTERWDSSNTGSFTYTIPNLTRSAPYSVRLDFAEIYFNRPNQRKFDVAINGTMVLSNFDIFAAAGGEDIAISRTFRTTSDGSGNIVIQFTDIAGYDHAKVDGIVVTPIPVAAIDAGGVGAGLYAADAGSVGGSAYSTTNPIDTSQVADPAPQEVYQTERDAAYQNLTSFTYAIPNLTPNATYVVRLDFAELYFDRPNQRKFDVAINGDTVLSDFDIYAAAGGRYIAISRSFTAVTDGSGDIVIRFTDIPYYDNAKVDGIVVTPVPSAFAINAGGVNAGLAQDALIAGPSGGRAESGPVGSDPSPPADSAGTAPDRRRVSGYPMDPSVVTPPTSFKPGPTPARPLFSEPLTSSPIRELVAQEIATDRLSVRKPGWGTILGEVDLSKRA